MPKRTRINAHTIVAYQDGEHRILHGGGIVIEGNQIIHVGKHDMVRVDETIEAADCVITPGFINTHTHLAGSPLDKSFV